MKPINLSLANPRGFCAGVDRAIEIVNRALDVFGAPVYVRHEVVHNKFVVDGLRDRGAIFVEELSEIPEGSIVIFSAHGVSQEVRNEASSRDFKVFDATCPLVTKVHMEVLRFSQNSQECVLIGHAGHPEVEGTIGQYDYSNGGDIYLVENVEQARKLEVKFPEHLAYVTQTTLSVNDTSEIIDILRQRFPEITGPKKNDICYATQNRQEAVKELSSDLDLMFVVGSVNSSNSNRLRELAEREGVTAYLIDDESDIQEQWLSSATHIGITAGASAPEILVQNVIKRLSKMGVNNIEEIDGINESIAFSLPKELRLKHLD
jgi:4-hydroxy-3-methylbut-2-en-1-yl diphosphate reductase